MLLSYQACIDNYGSDYQIRKQIKNGTLFMLEKGMTEALLAKGILTPEQLEELLNERKSDS